MKSEVLLAYHPKNRDEARRLYLVLREPLCKAGVALSLATGADAPGESAFPRDDQKTSTVIAMIGSDGSVAWDADSTFTRAVAGETTLIVPILIHGSPHVDIPASIRQRSVLAFEVSFSDAASLARLTSAIPQLERQRDGFNRRLPEDLANALLESTIRFYEENATQFIDAHEEEIPRAQIAQIFSFASHVERRRRLAERVRILDAGCGPGHHARFFSRCGFSVVGVDRCSHFIQHAIAVSKGDCSFVEGDLRELESCFSTDYRFDGIWANASCLHLVRNVVASTLDCFRNLLRPNGVLGISLQLGMSTLQREGRFFERYEAGEPAEMLRQHRFSVIDTMESRATKSTTGRTRIKQWLSLVATKE